MKGNDNYLVVNHKSSLDFGVYIQYPVALVHTIPDVTPTSIPGHSGDLITNNHRFQNITQTFNVYANKIDKYDTWSHLSLDFNNWLIGDTYQPFYLASMHEWYWEAYMSAPLTLTPQNDFEATGSFSINCKPYLRRTDSLKFRPVPQLVTNTTTEYSEPIFHIVGNGDFTITINGQDFKLSGVDGEIFIDSEEQWIYKHDINENRASTAIFPNNDFPLLKPGQNTIKLSSGSATKFEYKPNWRKLA